MTQTVIGIFEDQPQAEAAVKALLALNFSKEDIDISLQDQVAGRGDVTDENNTLGSRIGNYFKSIFPDTNDALRYAAVAQQGIVVALHTESYEDAIKAADTMDQFGAINVDERARLLEDSWSRDERTYQNTRENRNEPSVKVFSGIAENTKTSEEPGTIQEVTQTTRPDGVRTQSRIIGRVERDHEPQEKDTLMNEDEL
jgi:hypothetical protein